jgi:capsular polysaccharide biosynthesis protein
VFPKKWLFLAAGVVIGLVLSTLVMLLSLTFGNRFLTIDTIERVLGLPVLVALPNLPRARLRAAATLSQSGARRELPSR